MHPVSVEVSSSLSEELARQLGKRTQAEVRFDQGSRAIYASDLSHYRPATHQYCTIDSAPI